MGVLNLPKILREDLILWVIRTMFRVIQDVDMVMTRVNKFGRFAVAVLDPELIPKKMDVIIGNHFFELLFEVKPFYANVGVRNMCDAANVTVDGGNGDLNMKDVHESQPSIGNMDTKKLGAQITKESLRQLCQNMSS